MSIAWEAELAALLTELMNVQDELIVFLTEKRQLLVEMNLDRLAESEASGHALLARLQNCHVRRGELLAQAAAESKPSDSLAAIARTLPNSERARTEQRIAEAKGRIRLLQHHSFANWMFIQRSLLHLARLLEIIATGGRPQTTYGRREQSPSGGSLVDQAA